jgi:5-hydroxyisourate hydrolase
MPGISIHVVDVSRGVLCQGMAVAVYALDAMGRETPVARGTIGHNGLLDDALLGMTFQRGTYRAVFQAGDYFKSAGIAMPGVPFLDVVTFDFGIDDPQQHYHLPMKITPWGYSCFRGGA